MARIILYCGTALLVYAVAASAMSFGCSVFVIPALALGVRYCVLWSTLVRCTRLLALGVGPGLAFGVAASAFGWGRLFCLGHFGFGIGSAGFSVWCLGHSGFGLRSAGDISRDGLMFRHCLPAVCDGIRQLAKDNRCSGLFAPTPSVSLSL